MKDNKTVGAHSLELSQQKQEKISLVEQQEAMTEDYWKELCACVNDGYSKYKDSFYVVVITKREKLLSNVLRNYFLHRQSCPTPQYDESVYRYNRDAGRIEYLWTVPSKDTCIYLAENKLLVHTSEHQLLNFVLDFYAGKLDLLAKKFNGEIELIN